MLSLLRADLLVFSLLFLCSRRPFLLFFFLIFFGACAQADAAAVISKSYPMLNTEEFMSDKPLQQAIRRLWADSGVLSVFARASEYQLIDSAK